MVGRILEYELLQTGKEMMKTKCCCCVLSPLSLTLICSLASPLLVLRLPSPLPLSLPPQGAVQRALDRSVWAEEEVLRVAEADIALRRRKMQIWY